MSQVLQRSIPGTSRDYRQEHPILANVNVGGIRRRPTLLDMAPVKVVTLGPLELIDLTTWLVLYPRFLLVSESDF
jgi:hypothetical protein